MITFSLNQWRTDVVYVTVTLKLIYNFIMIIVIEAHILNIKHHHTIIQETNSRIPIYNLYFYRII
jgi:hypothetical protein